jgi:hypothetical protein
MSPLRASVDRIYQQFGGYPCPPDLWVCPQCGPQWSAEEIRSTPPRSVSLPQLGAIHVTALDDDALRHFFPRLMELLLLTSGPVFDFRLADLKDRLAAWQPEESAAVRELADAVWSELLNSYPADLGYFSDCPSALDLLDWCDLALPGYLDALRTVDSLPAARHLADLIDSVFTTARPFETASKTTVLDWLKNPAIGDRLQDAFFSADSGESERQLAAAHELWTACRSK